MFDSRLVNASVKTALTCIGISLCLLPAKAQLTLPDRLAQNTCWYMRQGGLTWYPAFNFAVNPVMLLIDERGVTPGYVLQNAQYILSDLKPYTQSIGQEELSVRTLRAIARTCGDRLSVDEYKEFTQ